MDAERKPQHRPQDLKPVFLGLAVVFCIALAVMIGRRLTNDAIAIIIGVVAGVLAALPTSFLLLIALTRRTETRTSQTLGIPNKRGDYPPVIIVQGGGQPTPYGPAGWQPGPRAPLLNNGADRERVRVIGHTDNAH